MSLGPPTLTHLLAAEQRPAQGNGAVETTPQAQTRQWFEAEPLWFKGAVFYEVHVRGFYDANGDGIGDFRGLAEKLDYLQWLGIDCIWLLPFYRSPLRDGGYDIADFTDIHSDYGTVGDVQELIDAAHARRIRVIADLVMNHTSVENPWFQESRSSADSPKRNWYVWSDTDDRYRDARIIFVDTESSNWTWDPVAGQYYWHRFFSHQPDLNYANPEVREAMIEVLRFWLDMGLDGFRLDAVPYLFEREGTNCENLQETHNYLRRIRREVDENYPDRVLLAEANQWPADVVQYFGEGDECHMAFHFPVMPRMFMAMRREEAVPIYEVLQHTPRIPESCQWGLFLRNHDELTLEMVTDEERDYMYSEYAKDPRMKLNLGIRRRLAPLLDNGRDEIELMHAILFSLPGSPVLYYGDEIAMGDNVFLGDRDGVRTPMQWTGDRNGGFSRADFAQLYAPPLMDPVFGFQAVNVEAQLRTPTSLLRWLHRFIALRKEHPVFGFGTYEPIEPSNPKIFAHMRRFEDDLVLCVHNLARSAQAVELDLRAYEGRYPVELFGRSRFPRIGELPYLLTLGSRGFYWFELVEEGKLLRMTERVIADVELAELLDDESLRDWIAQQRWYGAKARSIAGVEIVECLPLGQDSSVLLTLVQTRFATGTHELYQLPLMLVRKGESRDGAEVNRNGQPPIVSTEEWSVYDGLAHPAQARALLARMVAGEDIETSHGRFSFTAAPELESVGAETPVRAMGVEQSNTSVVFDSRFVLKVFRKLEPGINPELEMLRFLTGHGFPHIAALKGFYQYDGQALSATLGVAQTFLPEGVGGWELALDEIARDPDGFLARLASLGEVTAQMHTVLASDAGDPAFSPEEPSQEALALLTATVDEDIERIFMRLPDSEAVAPIAGCGQDIRERLAARAQVGTGGRAIRTHGDYHLGQTLSTPRGWVILDFEGEPARGLPERRQKRSPLRDVAGMLRSFAYVTSAVEMMDDRHAPGDFEQRARQAFLDDYLAHVDPTLLPAGEAAIANLLSIYELEKAIYELQYELNNRPDWVPIPVAGIRRLLETT